MIIKRPKDRKAGGDGSAAFAAAIKAALAEPDGERTKLHRVAQTLVSLAIKGNTTAIKEISDRLDGKAGVVPPDTKPGETGKSAREPIEVRVKWLKD